MADLEPTCDTGGYEAPVCPPEAVVWFVQASLDQRHKGGGNFVPMHFRRMLAYADVIESRAPGWLLVQALSGAPAGINMVDDGKALPHQRICFVVRGWVTAPLPLVATRSAVCPLASGFACARFDTWGRISGRRYFTNVGKLVENPSDVCAPPPAVAA